MTGTVSGVILDLIMLVCLGVTIFYAHRLSKGLTAFRQTRQEFKAIMDQLSKNIEEAQQAVESLKRSTHESGKNLQKSLNESRGMASELEIINQSSAKLAERLENLSEKNKRIAQGLEDPEEFRSEAAQTPRGPSFAIFDRDYGEEEDVPEPPPSPAGFQSQAEMDLFDALQKSRKISGRGMA